MTNLADTTIIAKLGLTELEVSFMTAFINGLYAEPNFSDQDVADVASNMGVSKATAKGVLGSLVKKNYLNTEDSGTGYDLIYLNSDKFYLHKTWRECEYEGCQIPAEYQEAAANASSTSEEDRNYTPWAERPRYGTKEADPATDAKRFQEACEYAETYAKKTGWITIVFKNSHGFYLTTEKNPPVSAITTLYTSKGGYK